MIYIILLSLIIILFVILFKFEFKQNKEGFKTDLDQDLISNTNCLDYITRELNWDIDYNIDKYLPKSLVDPSLIQVERENLINVRKDILKLFDNVKTKTYSGINLKYPSTGACILRSSKVENDLKPNDQCTFTGKYLSSELNPVDSQYGRRLVVDTNIKTTMFEDYIKSFDNKSQYYPNDGCIVDTTNKDAFFDSITQLGKVKNFDKDNELNLATTEKNKLQDKLGKLQGTLNLYGITNNMDFDTTIFTDCTNKKTSEIDQNGYTLDTLKKLDINCGDEEVLTGFKLNHDNNKTYYNYTCCKPHTSDNYIRPKKMDSQMTEEKPNIENPWDLNSKLSCDQFLNGLNLQAKNNYKYNCSTMYKKSPKDTRNIQFSCKDDKTNLVDTNSGTLNMQNLNVNCHDGMLKNVELIKDDKKYGYKYTCCRPYII
jgi:hypothetical protein